MTLAPGVRLIRAPNPSPMTERGTNTWLLGQGEVTIFDPGPLLAPHLEAILAALGPGERVAQIIVSHAHKDHSPLARVLAQKTGAPVLAFGDARAGRSLRMAALAGLPSLGGGEGVDEEFAPDRVVGDGASILIAGESGTILHTPGHMGNHICLLWGERLFSGDMVMGWAPSLVSPPDGDLTDFMASLARLERLGAIRLFPGHGDPVVDGQERIRALRAHRLAREAQVRAALRPEWQSLSALLPQVYRDVEPALFPAAARNLLAHLIDLAARGLAQLELGHDELHAASSAPETEPNEPSQKAGGTEPRL